MKKKEIPFLFYIYAKPNANTKKNCNKAISLNHYCTFFFFLAEVKVCWKIHFIQ